MMKLKNELIKILFMKLKPSQVYRDGITVHEIQEVTKLDFFIHDSIQVQEAVDIGSFLQSVIELEE